VIRPCSIDFLTTEQMSMLSALRFGIENHLFLKDLQTVWTFAQNAIA
jgi:hypothetical protein